MKIEPKLKNKTLAIFATLFLTLTLIVTVTPVSSNVVRADTYDTQYHYPNIPFSVIGLESFENFDNPLHDETAMSFPISLPSGSSYSTYTYYSDSYNDYEMASAITGRDLNYGGLPYPVTFEHEIISNGYSMKPKVELIAKNFAFRPYTQYLESESNIPINVFMRSYIGDYPLAKLDVEIHYASFLNYAGGSSDILQFSKTYDTASMGYFFLLNDIYNNLIVNAYTTYSPSSPVFIYEFEFHFSSFDDLSDVDELSLVFLEYSDLLVSDGYNGEYYELFNAIYFNTDYEISWFETIVESVSDFLEIEFLPDFSFGDLLFCVIAIPLAIWLLKLWLGG